MRELEARFAEELVVVGVHSGKYVAERVTARIREAALRLDVRHPVVNDRQFRVWRAYAVRAWPTIVVIDPRGRVVGMHAGELTAAQVEPFIAGLIEAAERDGSLVRGPLPSGAVPHGDERPAVAPGRLCYPGKVAVDGRRIAVASSGRHQLLVGELEGDGRRMRVTRVVGRGLPGLEDGAAGAARFTRPQGMAFVDDTLYVADAGNHALRRIALADGTVATVTGTGHRLRTRADREAGALASPWDVAWHDGVLWVAMAGMHQLWAVDPVSGAARVHAGTGGEEIADGPLAEALLAQPMGLAAHDGRLWFADAESSAVRVADADSGGRVRTLVGTGLFDFGDRDGAGDTVRLEHPQGVAVEPGSGRLLVADSYNDALKWLEPATRAVATWARNLHEPGGVAWSADGLAYVADTNAHRVVVVDAAGRVEELEIA